MGLVFKPLVLSIALGLLGSMNAHALGPNCSIVKLCKRAGFNTEGTGSYLSPNGGLVRQNLPKKNQPEWASLEAQNRALIIFEEAKKRLLSMVQSEEGLSEKVRASMAVRISSTQAELFDHREDNPYTAGLYDDTNRVRIDSSVVELPKANLINFFAHEIAHSFDAESIQQSVIGDLTSSIRIPEVNAKAYFPNEKFLDGEYSADVFDAIRNKLRSWGVTDDQYSESACDYFAAKVSAQYLSELNKKNAELAAFEGILDILTNTCGGPYYLPENKKYLSGKDRIEKLYFGNSEIAEAADCL